MSSQQPTNQTQHNGTTHSAGPGASSRSPSSTAMLSRFLYDRTGVPDRLVARSYNAATPGPGFEGDAAELERYMSQSSAGVQGSGSTARRA
ncbi:hypothetical protein M419DRAFT_8169 [Trichoderma reesei RUT C-30]|uniref:Uncharacterized protein n=1 Tax=Hypocrea jecorina (strain ATCC 56765 / BCRC 32924 / NRRL 11460 / Rut C-30) TaxID=1344414 RepID=A0A024SB22_HYPJR|nr:hypothetical protein M419DRAFT_8169 [Trichoderma reesei RUT C-30]